MSIILFILDDQPPSLIGGFDDFKLEAAAFLGYGDDPSEWTSLQDVELDRAVQDAYRHILYPSKIAGASMSHVWSWLRQVAAITTAAQEDIIETGGFGSDSDWTKGSGWSIGSGVATGASVTTGELSQTTPPLTDGLTYTVIYTVATITDGGIRVKLGTKTGITRTSAGTYTEAIQTNGTGFSFESSGGSFSGTIDDVTATTAATASYELPADFGSMHSREMTYAEETGWIPVKRTSLVQIRKRNQWSSYTEHPWLFALDWKPQVSGMNQRQRITFYPTPDKAYVLSYEYAVLVPRLSQANPYPLGGPRITQLMIEACKAIGEAKKNGQRGDQWNIFREQLADAIDMDAATLTERTVGRMESQYDIYPFGPDNQYGERSLEGSTYAGVI